MKVLKGHLFISLSLLLAVPNLGSGQSKVNEAKGYILDINNAPLSISRSQLNKASTLIDLNENYKADWVKKYLSVEVKTSSNGIVNKALSDNDILSQEQKHKMSTADEGSDITITVQYIPENDLVKSDSKEMQFMFKINPEYSATFANGQTKYFEYLEQNKIHDIVDAAYANKALAVVKFTVNEQGGVENVRLFESSKNDNVDESMLSIVRSMPNWKPAEYTSGMKVKQEMVLTAGNLESCVDNLLNIRKN